LIWYSDSGKIFNETTDKNFAPMIDKKLT